MKTLFTAIVLLIAFTGCEEGNSKKELDATLRENQRLWNSYNLSLDTLNQTLDSLNNKIQTTIKAYRELDSSVKECSNALKQYNKVH